MQCHYCKAPLRPEDFDQGRAITFSGVPCCDGCLAKAVEAGRQKARAPVTAPGTPEVRATAVPQTEGPGTRLLRRRHIRFAPPLECGLTLQPETGEDQAANVLRIWVDVSEGGVRAIVEGNYGAGDTFRGLLTHAALNPGLRFRAQIRHAKPSVRLPGCLLAGLQFVVPPRELGEFIRTMLDVPGSTSDGRGVPLKTGGPRDEGLPDHH